ncbi:MAG: sigma-54-dependent Fis family transcriptional regulator [Candidatus Cloacimonetes bacterium]|nr:sigma-54-dependent Fis family transcriptional regulator [Candidatus Cloacimonadota bacterium]MBL7085640.1 sigma-54-dependent Fis family transcriptional regulator [Candidatus Cloacimonadota bacterium]
MKILVVDDEKNIRRTLSNILEDEHYKVITAESGENALNILSNEIIDLMLLDVKLPGMDGIEVLKLIKKDFPGIDVIMISGHSTIKIAVQAVKMGAYDFLEKPLSLHKIVISAKNIAEKRKLFQKFQQESKDTESQYRMIGVSPEFSKILNLIDKVSATDSKVLIRGESGTGKELVAFAIHNQSARKNGPFVKFNSAAIPNELVESELFGYEKGAFTGANKQKLGKLEIADEGTLFLDEIGDMNLNAQAKILRVIQEGKFERVGSNKTITIDVRILAATNKNLEKMFESGEFREDLFYRLNVISIHIPSLRDRKTDIPVLLNYYLDYFAAELKIHPKKFSSSALKLLQNYSFPGNIRELRNLVERLYILTSENIILEDDVEPHIRILFESKGENLSFLETKAYSKAKNEFESYYLTKQLKKFNWNISTTANKLDLQQSNLSRKVKELCIKREN